MELFWVKSSLGAKIHFQEPNNLRLTQGQTDLQDIIFHHEAES